MITITNTITIAIAIAIAIAGAIISISPRLNADTYAHNRWKAGSSFLWTIWVGDLPSPNSKCLPFLHNLTLQLSTPWQWGIMRSCYGGHAKDDIQTIILTGVTISATISHAPSATRHPPPATCHPPTGAWLLQLSKSMDRAPGSIHGSIQ